MTSKTDTTGTHTIQPTDRFAVLLVDESDPVYSTLQISDDATLWEWSTQTFDPPFGSAETTRMVRVPEGYPIEGDAPGEAIWVSSGSPVNDLLHTTSAMLGQAATVTIDTDQFFNDEADDEDGDDVDAVVEAWTREARRLCAEMGVPEGRILTGLWY